MVLSILSLEAGPANKVSEMAPANEAEAEKERYFARLAALNDSSDDEIDANDGRQVLKKSKKVQYLQPIPNKSVPVPERQRMTATSKKVPKIHRTTSAPVSSGPKEKPPVVRKSSLRRVESLEHSIENVSSIPLDHHAGSERPTTSNQTMDLRPLVLINSTGIQSLLANKRKPTGLELVTKKQKKARKETVIEPVPLEQQFFAGKTFYFMPPDDVDPIRRNRITKVREFGAIWAKELISSTTHIVADKALTRKHVMNFLKLESLPQGIILVNEEYTFDCVARRFLLDHSHGRYALKGDQMLSEGVEEPGVARQTLEVPFEPKPVKSKFGDSEYFQMDQTPPRSQSSTQVSRSKGISESATIPAVPGINGSDESISPGDELDMIIQLALTKGLSLEEDEDDWETDGSAEDSEDSGTEDERPSSSDKGKKFGGKSSLAKQENFRCMTGGTGTTNDSNPNRRTIEVLQEMCDFYERTGDHWRERSYKIAIGALRKLPKKIATFEQAKAIPGIGDRLAKKIEEIVRTGGLRRLEYAKVDPNDLVLQIFMKIYGVGKTQGTEWVLKGYKTLEDLLAHAKLTNNQRLGIEHYDDLLQRIPREEVTALADIVRAASATVDSEVEVTIGGSYRRGAATSGDLDCLMTKPCTKSSNELLYFLHNLVMRLTDSGFLVAPLAQPSKRDSSGSKWHGCCVLPGSPKPIWRRIDLLLVPETELGAALIYFTGDDIFNRSIRLLAGRKYNRSLNQRGLYKNVMRGPGRVKLNDGELEEAADEKKIFAILGVPWRPPEQRICH